MIVPSKDKPCPCNSGKTYGECCQPFMSMLRIYDPVWSELHAQSDVQTTLLDWANKYSDPIKEAFAEKANTFVFRISKYLDRVCDMYLGLFFPAEVPQQDTADDAFRFLKHNILLSTIGGYRCLSEGLFLQSGTLLRCVIEDSLVLLDLALNPRFMHSFLEDDYDARHALKRVKSRLPPFVLEWYGYFSANFTHTGPLHKAPYMPNACYGDNWVLVIGMQHVVQALLVYHMALERCYLPFLLHSFFWRKQPDGAEPTFNDDSSPLKWSELLGKDIVNRLPPGERKPGFTYSERTYKLKQKSRGR